MMLVALLVCFFQCGRPSIAHHEKTTLKAPSIQILHATGCNFTQVSYAETLTFNMKVRLCVQARIVSKPSKSAKRINHSSKKAQRSKYSRALKEFDLRLDAGEADFRILVRLRIKVPQWLKHSPRASYSGQFYEIEVEGDPYHADAEGNLYLTKHKCGAHEDVIPELLCSLYEFVTDYRLLFLESKASYIALNGRLRRPDIVVYRWQDSTETNISPVLVEAQFEPLSLPKAHDYCLEYFQQPSVRAVALLKFFRRYADNPFLFQALAILYRRGPDGPYVADAVSFGTAPLIPASLNGSLSAVARSLRVLPGLRPVPHDASPPWRQNPWGPELRPFLAVPAEDFLCDALGELPVLATTARFTASPEAHCTLDLWNAVATLALYQKPWPRDNVLTLAPMLAGVEQDPAG